LTLAISKVNAARNIDLDDLFNDIITKITPDDDEIRIIY
jgi:hypothetical protein